MSITLRHMTFSDLDAAMALKDAEGWNQTEEDWDFFLKHTPRCCFVACDGEKVIGTVVGVNYSDRVAWIGMMLVNKTYRSQGVSKALMQTVIKSLHTAVSVKLDATPAGFPVYRKLGFVEECTLLRLVALDFNLSEAFDEAGFGVPSEMEMNSIYRKDLEVFGADRSLVLRQNLSSMPEFARYKVTGGELDGYLFGRKGTRFVHLGPLVADSVATAKGLLASSIRKSDPRPMVIDVPKSNAEWVAWLESCGFVVQRELYRMYLKGNPHPGVPDHVYAICGPELG